MGNIFEGTPKKRNEAKSVTSLDWPNFHITQCDWLKGSHMTKPRVVSLPNELDYSRYEYMAPKYSLFYIVGRST